MRELNGQTYGNKSFQNNEIHSQQKWTLGKVLEGIGSELAFED